MGFLNALIVWYKNFIKRKENKFGASAGVGCNPGKEAVEHFKTRASAIGSLKKLFYIDSKAWVDRSPERSPLVTTRSQVGGNSRRSSFGDTEATEILIECIKTSKSIEALLKRIGASESIEALLGYIKIWLSNNPEGISWIDLEYTEVLLKYNFVLSPLISSKVLLHPNKTSKGLTYNKALLQYNSIVDFLLGPKTSKDPETRVKHFPRGNFLIEPKSIEVILECIKTFESIKALLERIKRSEPTKALLTHVKTRVKNNPEENSLINSGHIEALLECIKISESRVGRRRLHPAGESSFIDSDSIEVLLESIKTSESTEVLLERSSEGYFSIDPESIEVLLECIRTSDSIEYVLKCARALDSVESLRECVLIWLNNNPEWKSLINLQYIEAVVKYNPTVNSFTDFQYIKWFVKYSSQRKSWIDSESVEDSLIERGSGGSPLIDLESIEVLLECIKTSEAVKVLLERIKASESAKALLERTKTWLNNNPEDSSLIDLESIEALLECSSMVTPLH